MAFAAIVSLKRETENYLINHETLLDPSSREILEFAYEQLESSQEIAKRMFGIADRCLVIKIRNAVYKLSTSLESLLSKQIDSEGTSNLEKAIHFFIATMKNLEEEYADELYNSVSEDEDVEVVVSPDMVGLNDQYNDIRERLIVQVPTKLKFLSLIGMQGIGKTSLSRKIFDDPNTVQHFDCRVWVKVGRKCRLKDVALHVLAQLNSDQMCVEKYEDFSVCLNESLRGKKYLIVLDDVWDKYMAAYLQIAVYSSRERRLKNYFPDEQNGSRILLTSRPQQVDEYNMRTSCEVAEMRLMNKEESWDLLREKVFGEESCCRELEKFGMKIAEKCDGLPLTIITVANLLREAERTSCYWDEIATRKNHHLFKAAYDEISKVLLPSYKHLPRLLQMCFLYIGVFPQNCEIAKSKLINLWKSDGFLGLNRDEYPSLSEMQCLKELASSSMVMICKNTSMAAPGVICKGIKICRLHSSLWHLSNREAVKDKFCYVLSIFDDVLGEGMKGQRRLSFHNNVLFGIKGLNKSVEDKCASTAHSLLCYGPYLQYQVPICSDLRLLRELDALTIRFYEFPKEVLNLVQLRYLALTLDGNIPPAIVKLSKLQLLIVDRHMSIRSSKETSYLPMEIWNMKELQHLQVGGNDLVNPRGASLESLSTLLRVSPKSCTEEVFRAIPKLDKLGIQVELSPDDDGEPLSCIGHVSRLSRLRSLKCVVVNVRAVPSSALLSTLPKWLRKLSLSGLGYAWEEMSKIDSLVFLRVLKLRNYAFRGADWEVREGSFRCLQTLVIEDTDLVKWKIGSGGFFALDSLILKSCYKLKEIDGEFGVHLKEIEMVDCKPLGAEQMKKATSAEIRVSCSWFDKKPKA